MFVSLPLSQLMLILLYLLQYYLLLLSIQVHEHSINVYRVLEKEELHPIYE